MNTTTGLLTAMISLSKENNTRLDYVLNDLRMANEWLKSLNTSLEEEPIIFTEDCYCGKCGEQIQCEHGRSESHLKSLCGKCAG